MIASKEKIHTYKIYNKQKRKAEIKRNKE